MNISAREQVARNIADTCTFGNLNDSYGVSVEKTADQKGKSYWSVTFVKARTLDGVIKVYSPSFILISWQGACASAAGLPFKGRQVCKSEADAKAFLINHFVSD